MISCFLEFNKLLKNSSSKIKNEILHKIIKKYIFLYISEIFNINQNQDIVKNFKESNSIVVNSSNTDQLVENNYFLISFKKTILLIKPNSLSFLYPLFSNTNGINICFLSNEKTIFDQNFVMKYNEIPFDSDFEKEISSFNEELSLWHHQYSPVNPIWNIIKSCISGFLIKQSYSKLKQNRIKNFQTKEKKTITQKDFINLRTIGFGSSFMIELVYHIENEELYAIKKPLINDIEISKLFKRESENYLKIQHPLIPHFIGEIKEQDHLAIEFINGRTLTHIGRMHLNDNEKITIIFEIIMTIEFLHRNHYIYRDLKPNNVMIDDSKTAILIDFDRMISHDYISCNTNLTNEFSSIYVAPETNTGKFSYESDIYSIGKMIYYIMNEKSPTDSNNAEFTDKILEGIYEKCIKENWNERPSALQLIIDFLIHYRSKIHIGNLLNIYEKHFKSLYDEELIYFIKDIYSNTNEAQVNFLIAAIHSSGKYIPINSDRAIHYFLRAADLNDSKSQFNLGNIYMTGQWIKQDIKKSIHYYSLAAKQNNTGALYCLGLMHYDGQFIPPNIQKSIHYFSLAAKLNDLDSIFFLGRIYDEGSHVKRDVKKAIHYLKLAADQGHEDAQCALGSIYLLDEENVKKAIPYLSLAANKGNDEALFKLGIIYHGGHYIKRDIDKAIHYFNLSANKGNNKAKFELGLIYFEGKYVKCDIDKAIQYFTLSANEGNDEAQFMLGQLYFKGQYMKRDIDKAIQYFSLSANEDNDDAQFMLGQIYFEGQCVKRDIDKAIHYFSLSANEGNVEAQFKLGVIYFEGQYVKRDVEKAIQYFTLSANEGNVEAQFKLGVIYFEGQCVSRDIDKSIHYLSMAAKQNDLQSIYNLGSIYMSGKYIKADIDKAIHYFRIAADKNFLEAQFNLGYIYYKIQDWKDIDKAIHYFSMVAKQNNSEAQFILGDIYYHEKNNLEEAIHFYSQASCHNHMKAQCKLGFIYYESKHNKFDINKSIHYFQLAAKQNCLEAQLYLGLIYYEGIYVPRDIYQSIHFYSLASDKSTLAQVILGKIYTEGKYVSPDFKKAFHYLSLAANQNDPQSHLLLGLIYYDNKFVHRDINKSIHHFTIAANYNCLDAQYNLGVIYYENKNVPRDINKSIYYFQLSANQNHSLSQYNLAFIYFDRNNSKQGLHFLTKSALNNCKRAYFPLGYIYHEGKMIKRNIQEAIHYYKEASSFNDPFAKNNLGIIFKNGFGDEIKKNLALSIEYFKEAINQKHDLLATYNLAHIYLFEIQNIEKSIELLIKLTDRNFIPSLELLCIALIKKHGFSLQIIQNEMNDYSELSKEYVSTMFELICEQNNEKNIFYEKLFQKYRSIEFIYNHRKEIAYSNDIFEFDSFHNFKTKIVPDISSAFYEGFGLEI